MGQIAKFADVFRAKAESIDRQWPLDPRSHPLYAMIVIQLGIEIVWIAATDFTIPAGQVFAAFAMLLWMVFVALIARAYGHARVACFLEAVSLPAIAGALTAGATALLSSVSLPFADPFLARADRALGLEWLALMSTYHAHPWLFEVSRFVYRSLHYQMPLIGAALVLFRRDERLWLFLTAFALTGLITAAIYPFFPAYGPFVLYEVSPGGVSERYTPWAWRTGPTIAGLRNGEIRDIASAWGGLVSFPSFHAAAAVLFAWAVKPLRWLGPPVVLLNGMMFFSTIIIGDHYFVDLAAGAAIALLAILISRRLIKQN